MMISRSSMPVSQHGAVVAIGNFDGVHRGHQAIIDKAGELARSIGRSCAVLTFHPHPRRFFSPQEGRFEMTPLREKCRLLAENGVNILHLRRFDKAFAALSAEEFIRHILVEQIGLSHAVVGGDFAFGYRRTGTFQILQEEGQRHGFAVSKVEPVLDVDGERFSSSATRHAIALGNMGRAEAILGHPWAIDARVITGSGRGSKIGIPTANMMLNETICPPFGVYGACVEVTEGKKIKRGAAVVNFGLRPTFGHQEKPVLEAHLFDFDGASLHGRRLRVLWLARIRGERAFANARVLRAQIEKDMRIARLLAQQRSIPSFVTPQVRP